MVGLLLRYEGHGDPAYLRRRGARAAEIAFDSGLYAQLRHSVAIGTLTEESGDQGIFTERDGRLMASLSGAIFNFGVWTFRDTPQGYEVEVREAAKLPDVLRHAIEGFLEVMTERTSRSEVRVPSRRVTPDVVDLLDSARPVAALRLPALAAARRLRESHEMAARRVRKRMSAVRSGLPPFERVVLRYGPALLRFCAAEAGSPRAEDCFQETLLAALRAYASVRDPDAIRSWLFSIAARKAIDLYRDAGARPAARGRRSRRWASAPRRA